MLKRKSNVKKNLLELLKEINDKEKEKNVDRFIFKSFLD